MTNRFILGSFSIKWFFIILSGVRLVPIVQSTYLSTQLDQFNQTDLSTLESIQDEAYVQNRDYFLGHLNQLNNFSNEHRKPFDYGANERRTDENITYEDRPNVLTKRIALSSLANIFGSNSDDEEKKLVDEKTTSDNQTTTDKSLDARKENVTLGESTNATTISLENQSAFLKNHLQNDKELETLNRLINFSKNYENWSDHLKNPYNLNHHRQDLINLLHLNGTTNLADLSNATADQPSDQTSLNSKPKNLFFLFSPEYAGGKSASFESQNNHFKPNSLLSSSLVSGESDYFSRHHPVGETMTDASDQNTEYDDTNSNAEENQSKLIDHRNESAKPERRRKFRNRNRSRSRAKANAGNKVRKTPFDNQPFASRNIVQSGFRPVDNKLLKEQSQISASTGIRRNSVGKSYRNRNRLIDLSLVETTQQNQNENTSSSNTSSKPKRVYNQTSTTSSTTTTSTTPSSASSFEQEFNQLSVGNQPYVFKPQTYRFPTNLYGKRLINDILNSQPNVRKNLVSSSTSSNKVNNESVDNLDDENNDAKEDVLNEKDIGLVTDRTKESLYEKSQDDELNELNEYENKELDKNSELVGQPHQSNQQLNQQIESGQLNQQLSNQLNPAEIESSENDTMENENELNNSSNNTIASIGQSKESDSDAASKAKQILNELNKSTKQDKNSLKFKPNKKTNWKQFVDPNYKHYKIFDKYSKSGDGNAFNFDPNFPMMNSYLSNENFKINLGAGKSSELDDDLAYPYPNVQYGSKPNSFNNLYYPLMKKKPFFSSYPSTYPGFTTNPLNSMLFDKISMPIDSYSIDKLPPSLSGPLPMKTGLDKSPLDNKFYNLDSKLHHLNSKYSLNALTPPFPHHLEATKYYEPKGHYDSKYHNINHWQSGLAGFLLGKLNYEKI